MARGDWWKVYKDRALDALLPQIEVSNQTAAAASAAYEEARAVIRDAEAALFPLGTAGYNVTRTRTGLRAIGANTSAPAFTAVYVAADRWPIAVELFIVAAA